MKPLKFRAWHDGLMYSVYHMELNESGVFFVEMRNNEAWSLFHTDNLDSIVLMQFTGLRDRNGKEIYRDDILRIEGAATGTVIEGRGGYIIEFADGRRLSFEDTVSEHIEIVGNTWESKELVEVSSV